MNRIAPNNQLPATHFIEVWKKPTSGSSTFNGKIHLIKYFELVPIDILWPPSPSSASDKTNYPLNISFNNDSKRALQPHTSTTQHHLHTPQR